MDDQAPLLQHHRSYLFTVRLWFEDLGNGRMEWRGKVLYTPTGEACYFREWPVFKAFLAKHALSTPEIPGPEPGGEEREC